MKRPYVVVLFLFLSFGSFAQLDSLAKNLVDTLKSKLIVEDIPKKTLKDKFMYPHRWYVKQLLTPRTTDIDTTFIKSNKRKLTIAIPISKKFYGFNLNDLVTKSKLKFSPNNYYNVGFNFSNIILTFGFAPGIKFGAKSGRGTTRSTDFQLTIIGRRVITDVNYQNYNGFYVYNTKEFELNQSNPDSFVVRPDIQVNSFGVNTMFVFNYKKYSLRGAFSFTDVQLKSAGSWMAGLYHSNVVFSSKDSTFVNTSFKPKFSPLLNEITTISVITVGLSGGYGYTYVYKKFIVSSALNLGIGGQKTNYKIIEKEQGQTLSLNSSAHVNIKIALRYDNLKFFTGVLATYDNNYTFNSKIFNTENYIGRVVLFVGYRFNIKQNGRKVLKAMGLIDYETKNK